MAIVIIGTGLTESILAGALQRAGKSVLHLDLNEYYGSLFKSVPFIEMIHNSEYHLNSDGSITSGNTDDGNSGNTVDGNITIELISDTKDAITMEEFNQYKLQQTIKPNAWFMNTKILVDLMPQFVYGNSTMIDILVKAKVGQYLEFQLLKTFYMIRKDGLQLAPMSREDIFSNKEFSLVEKRRLMKFLTNCLSYNDEEILIENFCEYLESLNIPLNIRMVIISTILFHFNVGTIHSIETTAGINMVKKFMKSIGKYGPSPLLSGNYGTGSELCQSFCRYAAVYGASYILGVVVNDLQFAGAIKLETNMGTFTGEKLIISAENAIALKLTRITEIVKVQHLVCISQHQFGNSSLHTLYFECPDIVLNEHGVLGVQSCSENQLCPEGTFILNLQTLDTKNSLERLKNIAKKLSNG